MADRESMTEAKAPWLTPVLIFGGVLVGGIVLSKVFARNETPAGGYGTGKRSPTPGNLVWISTDSLPENDRRALGGSSPALIRVVSATDSYMTVFHDPQPPPTTGGGGDRLTVTVPLTAILEFPG